MINCTNHWKRARAAAGLVILLANFVMVTAAQDAAPDEAQLAATRMFSATAALQNGGLYERAAARWEEFLRTYPRSERAAQVHYHLGICRLHTQEFDKAAAAFGTVLTQFPQSDQLPAARFHLGMALYQSARTTRRTEDFTAAAAKLGEAAQGGDGKYAPQALYLQAESLYAAGQKEASLPVYRQLLADHPQHSLAADGYYYLGVALQELGRPAEAVDTYTAFLSNPALQRHVQANEVQLRLGMVLYEQRRFDIAERVFGSLASSSGTDHADFALLRQAQCRIELGRLDDAVERLERFIQNYPASGHLDDARLALGKSHFERQRFDEAVRVFKQLSGGQQGRRGAESAYWLASSYVKNGHSGDALAVLESALTRPDQAEFAPYLQLAYVDALYASADRRGEIADRTAEFLKRFPDSELVAQLLHTTALAALQQEDFAAARAHTDAFLARAGAAEHELFPAIQFIRAECHLLIRGGEDAHETQQALALYRGLVSKFPNHLLVERARVRIGWCLYREKKYGEVISQLEHAVDQLRDLQNRAEANFVMGRSHAATDEHRKAVAAYDLAFAAAPSWNRGDELLLAAAQSLYQLGDDAQAQTRLAQIETSFAKSPRQTDALFLSAEIARRRNDRARAIAMYSTVLERFPQSELAPAAAFGVAATHFAADEFVPAGAALDRLIQSYPTSESAHRGRYLRGVCRQRQKDLGGAIDDFTEYLASQPKGTDASHARYAVAVCELGRNQPELATKLLSALVHDEPTYEHLDKVHYDLGHSHLAAKKPAEAAKAFAALIEQRPSSSHVPESWFHVGAEHERLASESQNDSSVKPLEEARSSYAKGLERADKELREKLIYKLGTVLFKQRDFAAASSYLQAQVKEYPEGALLGAASFLAGQALYELQRFDEALELLRHSARSKERPHQAHALYLAGASAGHLKRWSDSRNFYSSLIEEFPKFERVDEAHYGLGWALQNEGRPEEARQIYAQVVAKSNVEAAAKAEFMLGELDFAAEKYADAIEHFLKAALGYPYPEWQALGHFEAGRCWLELGNKEQAIASLTKVLEKHPQHEKAASAAAMLAQLKK